MALSSRRVSQGGRLPEYTRPPMEWLRRNAPTVLMAGALLVAAGTLLALMAGQTFFQDTWAFLLDRQDLSVDAFLAPHNEHIAVIPVAINKLLIALFGMTSALPEQIVMTIAVLAAAWLLFVYIRRRIGAWGALIGAALFLYLGSAWADLIWPFQLAFVGSVVFGIAMLLALDRGDRRGDIAATAFLAVSLGFSSLGLSFLIGAAADVAQRRRSHGLLRIYVAAAPALLYGAWWLGWGREAETHVTLTSILTSPRYVVEGAASALESLLGLNKAGPEASVPPEWGLPILVAVVCLIVYGQLRGRGVSPRFWPVAAAAAANWLLEAFNAIPGREAYQARYTYAGAAFVLLLSAELLWGLRFTRRGLQVAGTVAVGAISVNLIALREGGRWLDGQTLLTRAELTSIEIARRTVDPAFYLSPDIAGTGSLAAVSAGAYLRASDEHGSPAYTSRQLAEAPQVPRHYADIVLARALPISTAVPNSRADLPLGDKCVTLAGGAASRYMEVPLPPGLSTIEPASGRAAELSLRRFATGEFPVVLDAAPGGAATVLRIPRDTSSRPWYLHVEASQRSRVCT